MTYIPIIALTDKNWELIRGIFRHLLWCRCVGRLAAETLINKLGIAWNNLIYRSWKPDQESSFSIAI